MVVPSEDPVGSAVVVRDRDGSVVNPPRPITFAQTDVVAQLLPDEAGVDPGSLLEVLEQGEHVGS
jgi:hypothetical protein